MKLNFWSGALGAAILIGVRAAYLAARDYINKDMNVFVEQILQKAYPDYSIFQKDIESFLSLFKIKNKRAFSLEKDAGLSNDDVKGIFIPNPAQKRHPPK